MTVHAPLGRRRLPSAAMAVGGAMVVVGSFLPWVRTGSRDRNSYDVFRVVGRLGFAPDGPAATALRWWPLVPLLTIGAVVAVWWGWVRIGGAVGILAATYAGGVGLAVWGAPATELVDIGAGPALTRSVPPPCSAGRSPASPSGSGTTNLRRRSPPLTAADEDVLQDRGDVGHDAVDAQVEQADHLVLVVDRPHVHLDAAPVARPDEAARHHRDAVGPCRHLRREHRRAGDAQGAQQPDLDLPGARADRLTEAPPQLADPGRRGTS